MMSPAVFDAQPCYCGHIRAEHRKPAKCVVCTDGHYFRKPEHHALDVRRAAALADPLHVHGETHTAYGCPGWIPFQVCDDCGESVP